MAVGTTGAVYLPFYRTHPCHCRASLTHRRQQLQLSSPRVADRLASGARPLGGLSSPRPVVPAPFAADPDVENKFLVRVYSMHDSVAHRMSPAQRGGAATPPRQGPSAPACRRHNHRLPPP